MPKGFFLYPVGETSRFSIPLKTNLSFQCCMETIIWFSKQDVITIDGFIELDRKGFLTGYFSTLLAHFFLREYNTAIKLILWSQIYIRRLRKVRSGKLQPERCKITSLCYNLSQSTRYARQSCLYHSKVNHLQDISYETIIVILSPTIKCVFVYIFSVEHVLAYLCLLKLRVQSYMFIARREGLYSLYTKRDIEFHIDTIW